MKPVPWLSLVSENWVLAFLLLALICFFSFSQLRYNLELGDIGTYSNSLGEVVGIRSGYLRWPCF
jgi:hypothetical protein